MKRSSLVTPSMVLLVIGTVAGCSEPSTDAVCNRYAQLMIGEPRKGSSKERFDEEMRVAKQACLETIGAAKSTDSSAYAKIAGCIMKAEDRAAMERCD